jgi:hypothetical protein
MKKEIIDLVEAVRALEMRISPTLDNDKNVKLFGDKKEYPYKFYNLLIALEAFDKAGSNSFDDIEDPALDSAKLRLALDGVFKWMRSVGIDVSEPHAIVSDTLGYKNKKEKPFRPVPKYAMNSFKKKIPNKILLGFDPGPGEKINIDSLREKVYQSMNTLNKMGNAAAR